MQGYLSQASHLYHAILYIHLSNYKNIFLRVEETQRVIKLVREECWMNEKTGFTICESDILEVQSWFYLHFRVLILIHTQVSIETRRESSATENIHKIIYISWRKWQRDKKSRFCCIAQTHEKINPRNDGEKNMHT